MLSSRQSRYQTAILEEEKALLKRFLIVLMSMQYVQYLAFHSNQKGSPMITYLTQIPGLAKQASSQGKWLVNADHPPPSPLN